MNIANNPKGGKLSLVLILSAAALGIFLVPWYVPVKEPAMTESYTYGFNNSVAILTVGVTLAALFLYFLFRWRAGLGGPALAPATADTFAFSFRSAADSRLFLSFIAAAILYGGVALAVYCYIPFYRSGEMGYFISRLECIVLGRSLYTEIPFSYGPAMLYLSDYLYLGAHGMLSIEQAYCVTLILFSVTGLYFLFYCVRTLFPPERRLLAFWVFAVITLGPGVGLQYTLLRFTMPVAALLLYYSAASGRPAPSFRAHLWVALAAFVGAFVNFEISPEMGLAFTLALAVYSIALLRTPGRAFAHGALFALLGAAAAVLPWFPRYFDVFFSFAGGRSLPIFPGLAILLFLFAAFFFLPRFAIAGFISREPHGAASLSFCVYCGILIDAALNRCDQGHVYANGLGLFLVAAAVLSRLPEIRWFRRFLAALFLIFAVLGQWCFLFHSSHSYEAAASARAWMRSHPLPPAPPASRGFLFSKRYPPMQDFDALLSYGPLATPLGCPENIERFLLLHGRDITPLNPGNYEDIDTLTQTTQAFEKIDAMHTILVPRSYFTPAAPSSSPEDSLVATDLRFLRHASLFPLIKLTPRHPFFEPLDLIAAHISQKFTVIGEFGDYLIMVHRAGRGG